MIGQIRHVEWISVYLQPVLTRWTDNIQSLDQTFNEGILNSGIVRIKVNGDHIAMVNN
jgi:hypothetical protein